MAMTMDFNLAPLKALAKKFPQIFEVALQKGAIQLLNWSNNGSAKSSRKPPIRYGVLRGSSSAFVGSKLVYTYKQAIKPGSPDSPTPNKSHSDDKTTITVGYNVDYAAKMHQWKGNWGEYTLADGNSGSQWLSDHLKADRFDLMKMISVVVKKKAGM